MKTAAIVFVFLTALSAAAITFVYRQGWTLYYGDAEAHLNIARRIVDSRTPGYDQIGTVWLPLPHVLMLPLVGHDVLWRSGLAGAIPSGAAFVLAGMFLFAALRLVFACKTAAAASVACFALNPNLLYLQSVPMTEAVLCAAVLGLLYFTVAFAQRPSLGLAAGAGLASAAASLTRYEGWFLIPFVALYLLYVGRRRWSAVALFCVLAGSAPLYWMAHNFWYFGNALDFYNGPYSAMAIQGNADYPGYRDWGKAWIYFREAAWLCAGGGSVWLGLAGLVAALWKRAWWPVGLLALAPLFYVWSVHSSKNPIFVPTLWPGSYYNSRYGMAAWPWLAVCAGALVAVVPVRARLLAALAVVAVSIAPWLLHPGAVCWKESQVNSVERRAWTREAAGFLGAEYRSGTGIVSPLGDVAGVYREAGIPLREVLQDGNGAAWQAALARPDLFLHEDWAVALRGDTVETVVRKMPRYKKVRVVAGKVEIYKRD